MSKRYAAETWLDVKQREMALNFFFADGGSDLPESETLRREAYRSLGRVAVGFASSAFNDGDRENAKRLMKLAVSVSPEVRRSWPWTKLTCKRFIGRALWNGVRTVTRRQM
jgi:hypothetical protein